MCGTESISITGGYGHHCYSLASFADVNELCEGGVSSKGHILMKGEIEV